MRESTTQILARPKGTPPRVAPENPIPYGKLSARRLREGALRALLYYDIWQFPLSATELHLFMPIQTLRLPPPGLLAPPNDDESPIVQHQGYYFVRGRSKAIVARRLAREHHARFMWRMAHLAERIMKRFPFVRAIFVSGELSKNSTGKGSDIDFFILTEPGRLWIARTLLILFKKVFLLNSRKFFCLNAFLSTDALRVNGEDIYIASEVAHLKALYNSTLCSAFMDANRWVTSFFPNFRREALPAPRVDDRRSLVQLMLERVLDILPLDRIDIYLQGLMKGVWERRYPEFGSTVREKIFRCSRQESRAYVGNFQEIVLAQYRQRLVQFGLSE